MNAGRGSGHRPERRSGREMARLSNCLVFALWRWMTRGGYLIVRWSRYRWVPHFLWSPPGGLEGAQVEHFVPINPGRGRPWAVWNAGLFRGRVRYCDRVVCAGRCAGRGRRCGDEPAGVD